MLIENEIVLTIQGKVKQKVIKQLTADFYLHENQGWYFVDWDPLDESFSKYR